MGFQYRSVLKGNQYGGGEYDDWQNWLDMTSHEKPLFLSEVIAWTSV